MSKSKFGLQCNSFGLRGSTKSLLELLHCYYTAHNKCKNLILLFKSEGDKSTSQMKLSIALFNLSSIILPSFQRSCDSAASLLCSSVSAVSSSAFAIQTPQGSALPLSAFAPDGFFSVNSCSSTRASINHTRSARASCLTREQLRYLAASSSCVTCLG